ncbi:hypothetical protein ACIBSW_14085 [Actinoplanes sp. NPDC049668]|uniref:DUF6197 family protein n=1 Tax=unclassified Actinoplanes TaxID=2626549 RepID=UPI00339FFA4B
MHRTQNPTGPAADTDNTTVVTPADILRGAACYLEIHGLVKGAYYAPDGQAFPPASTVGALSCAAFGETHPALPCRRPEWPVFRKAQRYLRDYLARRHEIIPGEPGEFVFLQLHNWNDAADQTAAHVITTLRAAADEWDYAHASEDDLETYAEACIANETHPTREGFLAWLGAR